jgi:hypothetical protein
MKRILSTAVMAVFLCLKLSAQVTFPQIPLTGNIGSGGLFPLLNSGTIVMASDANRTMLYPEMTASFIKITSTVSLTATRNIVAPLALGFAFTIENNTTGSQALQVIANTGTGVPIANGATVSVVCDGTNYVVVGSSGGVSMVYPGAGIPNSTGTAWGTSYGIFGTGSVLLGSGAVGSAAYTASSAYDAAGAAAAALAAAETFSANASNLASGTVPAGLLPLGSASAFGALKCGSGTTCTAGVISATAGGAGTVTTFTAPSGSWPSWLVPTVTNPTTTPNLAVAASAIPNAALAAQTANTVLGVLTATTPSGLALPSCSGASNALIFTLGVGFGCNSITSGSAAAGTLTGTTLAANVVNSSIVMTGDVTGTTGANSVGKVNGTAIPASAAGLATTSGRVIIPQTAGNIASILGFIPVGPPNFTGDLATGVLADYDFSEGTGTSLTDISGANACSGSPCNGTFGGGSATAPTWNGTTSVLFSGTGNSQGITLPATLNAAETFVIAYYFYPISLTAGGAIYNQGAYAPIISSSNGSSGINFIYAAPCAGGYFQPAIWNGSCATLSKNFGAGFHIATYVLGTGSGNLDHIYLDGTEVPYSVQGSTAGAQTSGNLFIGTANTGPWAGGGGTWLAYRMRVYSGQLTAADVMQITQIFRQVVQNKGIATSPLSFNTALPFLHCVGDSQTFGTGVATPFCSELTLTNQPAYTVDNWGVGGMTLQGMTASDQYRVGPYCPSTLGIPSVANVFGGTNDATQNVLTPAAFAAATFQSLMGEVQTLKRAGCTVFVSTMLSRFGTDSAGNTFDADSVAYNQLIRQGAVAGGAAGITDWDNPLIQAVGAAPSAGSTYFQSGGLHLTQAGTNLQATMMSGVLNHYFGTTAGSPTLPTGTYSMLPGDAFLSTSALTANATLTLPDCMGATGALWVISNPQYTFVVTLKNAVSTELINGRDYSSVGYTVPPGSTQTFTDVALPQATSGCVWALQTAAPVSNLVTSATGGSGTGTVSCVSASCTNLRGTYSVAGGTFTTGVFLTLGWPATPTAYACTASSNGVNFGVGNSVATTTGMTLSNTVTIIGTTATVNYSCQP